ncbi:MAG TPA: Fis family transcriptional regulator [Bacteroidetes bacterium]|nr:sigma-54-dependent Fis family transcriptional regulator [Ignavibacteria bacterium]HCA42716.1 Fis family transcriptional regulator [Bacteroidota bacterium]HCN37886.1 Fis family transcriptional regulator [Bacteroidota bacterium]
MRKILVVDDENTSQQIIKRVLESADNEVTLVSDGFEALTKMKKIKYDVIVTDLNMPDMNGIELTKKALEIDSDIIIILITAYGTIKSAVEAIRIGAFDYLTKPVDKKELLLSIDKGIERLSLIKENILLKYELDKVEDKQEFLTDNEQLKMLLTEVKKVSNSDSTVLITGETGTGKELLAKYIHFHSPRRKQHFVVVNCASIPKQSLESELFGHLAGSFEGASRDLKGYFEIAENGTIFLDEIGKIDPLVQIKILRVLKDKQFSRIGDSKTQTTNARIIVSTSDNLEGLIREGKFIQDLYYRINVFDFHLTPLRERPDDIIYYFKRFVKEFSERNNKVIKDISSEVKKMLLNYTWPGNVTELKNIAERCAILCESEKITTDYLPERLNQGKDYKEAIASNDFNKNKRAKVKEFEINFIKKFLRINKGNVTATARDINFHPVTLRQKIIKLGINPKEFKGLKLNGIYH